MLAIIGGSGLDQFSELEIVEERRVTTPYGDCSASVTLAKLNNQSLLFLPRHGKEHKVAPHRINYRANMWALKESGATHVLAINAVGGISEGMSPGVFVVPHQLIDYTCGREHSYDLLVDSYDLLVDGYVNHIDFSNPYNQSMRENLIVSLAQTHLSFKENAVYACTQGPRLETAAEIQRLKRDGCDLVGMTAMPEAALARELDLKYASLCLVVNWAAGLAQEELSMTEIMQTLHAGINDIKEVIRIFSCNNA